jgi:microcystin-dependent protein
MSSPFVAEIRMFGFNFAPMGWAQCNGQLMPISQNTALFSLLGTFYGGDGKTTFALPDLQGAVPINQGQGAGLSERFLGEASGSEFVTLGTTEIPIHNHSFSVTTAVGNTTVSGGNQLAKPQAGNPVTGLTQGRYFSVAASNDVLNPATSILPAGSSLPHNNMMPYLAVNFCIALQGVFPPRS